MDGRHGAAAGLDAPCALLDLDDFDANAAQLLRRAGGRPIRVASKSVRCRALLERVLAVEGFSGVMAYAVAEANWLVRSGLADVFVAYPSADRAALADLAGDPVLRSQVTVTVDSCGRRAPRHCRGRNTLIGVSASTWAPSGRIGPSRETL